mgnify:CR=1 FL=1
MSVSSSYAQRQRAERNRSLLHDYSAQFGRIADRFAAEAALRLGKEQAEQAAAGSVGRQGQGRGGQSRQVRLPGQHESRAADSAQRHHRLLRHHQGADAGPVENERYLEYIRDINNSANHLLSVINDILDLSKIEFGNVPLIEENVDLDATIASCLTIIGERARNGGLAVEYKPLKKMPILWVEQRRIKQVLINLLSNAVKFTPTGGSIAITLRRERDDSLAIAVTDSGIGIRQEDMAVVMAPFGQVDTGLNRKFEGTGLGLPLTKAFVEMHGGRLTLASELGKGTTATVMLPRNAFNGRPRRDEEISRAASGTPGRGRGRLGAAAGAARRSGGRNSAETGAAGREPWRRRPPCRTPTISRSCCCRKTSASAAWCRSPARSRWC